MSPTADIRRPRMLHGFAGRVLQRALNHALSLDPSMAERLVEFNGRSAQLHLRDADIDLRVDVVDGRLVIGPAAQDASLRVSTTPGSVLAMLLRGGAVAPGAVEIAGDAGLARQLEQLLRSYAPDLEAALSDHVGEVLGVPLANAAREAMHGVRKRTRALREDSADWLRDEAELVPPRGEVEDFLDDVDALRERTDRLAARLDRLERTP